MSGYEDLPTSDDLGRRAREWGSGRNALRAIAAAPAFTKQIIREGRLVEVLRNLWLEAYLPVTGSLVEPVRSNPPGILPSTVDVGPATVRLTPTPALLDGYCPGRSGTTAIAWRRSDILGLDAGFEPAHIATPRPNRRITAIHRLPDDTVLVATPGEILRGRLGDDCFRSVLQLSHPNCVVLPQTMTTDAAGRVFAGEYANLRHENGRWRSHAWIHWSEDFGTTWQSSDVLIGKGVNKHIHLLAYCTERGALVCTTGDNRKWVWELTNGQTPDEFRRSGLRRETSPLRLGGYTGTASTARARYWGSDYPLGSNFVVSDPNVGAGRMWFFAEPYRRNPVIQVSAINGNGTQIVLAVSWNQHQRGESSSALLGLHEAAGVWHVLSENARGSQLPIRLLSCSCCLPKTNELCMIGGSQFVLGIDG